MKLIQELQILCEVLEKNKWTHLLSSDKDDYHFDLISVVQNAYKHTSLGSFVNSIRDVRTSDWLALDYDENPDIDIAIFYRPSRALESWIGFKIQGIGHDGARDSRDRVIGKLAVQIMKAGWWIEASGGISSALHKAGVDHVTDQKLMKTLFPNIDEFHNDGSYTRDVGGNIKKKQWIMGNPTLK